MNDQFDFGGSIVWEPQLHHLEQAHLTAFMHRHNIDDYSALMHKSTTDPAWFTQAILDYLEIEFYVPYSTVLDLSDGLAWPQWCVGAKLNIVHNCLDKYLGTSYENQAALLWETEEGISGSVSYKDLAGKVNQCANALRKLGLGKGDAIGIFMPMVPEIVVAFLAIAKIGGIILPLFSGYGVNAVVTRLSDVDAKALFTADGFFRRGKPIAMKPIADEAVNQVQTVKHVIVVNRAGLEINIHAGRDHWWHDLVEPESKQAQTENTSAEDILMVIYTSGTTGRPKGAVHTHCGFPVKAAQDMAFGTDVHRGDIIFWLTDMGWMMGPWLVFGALILGGTFLIYDGAPDYPRPGSALGTCRQALRQLPGSFTDPDPFVNTLWRCLSPT